MAHAATDRPDVHCCTYDTYDCPNVTNATEQIMVTFRDSETDILKPGLHLAGSTNVSPLDNVSKRAENVSRLNIGEPRVPLVWTLSSKT